MARKRRVQRSARQEAPFAFPLENSLGFLLRDVGRMVGKVLAARIAPHGMSVQMWFLLRLIGDQDGITQREISQRAGIMEPSALETLRGMEQQGLIIRTRNASDRRKVDITLSRKGRNLLVRLLPIANEVNDLIHQCAAPEDVHRLERTLMTLRSILAAQAAEALPSAEATKRGGLPPRGQGVGSVLPRKDEKPGE